MTAHKAESSDGISLVDWDNAPPFLRIPCINRFYRVAPDGRGYSLRETLISINPFHRRVSCVQILHFRQFRQHNQLGNIVTHAIPAIVLIVVAAAVLWYAQVSALRMIPPHQDQSTRDRVVILMTFLSFVLCFVFSAVFHTFNCMGKDAYFRLIRWDISGITVFILGTFLPNAYFGLQCHPFWRLVHLTVFAANFSVVLWATQSDWLYDPANRLGRFLLLLTLPTTILIGGLHHAYFSGFWAPDVVAYVPNLAAAFLCALLGAFAYLAKIPESWVTDSRFDVWGNSHNLWHLACVGTSFLLLQGTMNLWEFRSEHGCQPSDSD